MDDVAGRAEGPPAYDKVLVSCITACGGAAQLAMTGDVTPVRPPAAAADPVGAGTSMSPAISRQKPQPTQSPVPSTVPSSRCVRGHGAPVGVPHRRCWRSVPIRGHRVRKRRRCERAADPQSRDVGPEHVRRHGDIDGPRHRRPVPHPVRGPRQRAGPAWAPVGLHLKRLATTEVSRLKMQSLAFRLIRRGAASSRAQGIGHVAERGVRSLVDVERRATHPAVLLRNDRSWTPGPCCTSVDQVSGKLVPASSPAACSTICQPGRESARPLVAASGECRVAAHSTDRRTQREVEARSAGACIMPR